MGVPMYDGARSNLAAELRNRYKWLKDNVKLFLRLYRLETKDLSRYYKDPYAFYIAKKSLKAIVDGLIMQLEIIRDECDRDYYNLEMPEPYGKDGEN